MRLRPGQAMLETALAVFFITFVFLLVFQVAHMVTTRILLDHAAARAARAKAVGFNDWMCLKSARVAMMPVAGRRLWPVGGELDGRSLVPIYMQTDNEGMALGVLDFERWHEMDFKVDSGHGMASEARSSIALDVPVPYMPDSSRRGEMRIEGEAAVESHFPLYMDDQGL